MDKLKGKKVVIKPLIGNGNTMNPKGHDGEFKFTNCSTRICLRKTQSGGYQRILDKDEIKEYAEALGYPEKVFSFNKKLNPTDTRIWTDLDFFLSKADYVLDMEDPADRLKLKIAEDFPLIANNFEKSKTRPDFLWYIDTIEDEKERKTRAKDKQLKAMDAFKRFTKTKVTLIDVLMMLGKTYTKEDSDKDLLDAELMEILMNKDPKKGITVDEILKLDSDPDLELSFFVRKAIHAGEIKKDGQSYLTREGEHIPATTEREIISWVKKDENKNWVKTIEVRLKRV